MDPKGIAIVITKKKPARHTYGAGPEEEDEDTGEEIGDEDEGLEISPEEQAAADDMLAAASAGDKEAHARALKSFVTLCKAETSHDD